MTVNLPPCILPAEVRCLPAIRSSPVSISTHNSLCICLSNSENSSADNIICPRENISYSTTDSNTRLYKLSKLYICYDLLKLELSVEVADLSDQLLQVLHVVPLNGDLNDLTVGQHLHAGLCSWRDSLSSLPPTTTESPARKPLSLLILFIFLSAHRLAGLHLRR